MNEIETFILTAITLVLVDSTYLYLIKHYFANQIYIIQGTNMSLHLLATIMCYILLVSGLYYFIIKNKKSVLDAFILGIVIYGVFETTNKALFTKWKWMTVLIDSLWGGILFAVTTFIIQKVFKSTSI